LIIKITYKSHFKVKRFLKKKDEKKILIKNILIFLLVSKIFFKNCKVNFLLLKKKKFSTSLLKAPSRHKRFFHQIAMELFFLKIFFFFKTGNGVENTNNNFLILNRELNNIFLKLGSNTLNRVKFRTVFKENKKFELFY
jgi:hypothetical protein